MVGTQTNTHAAAHRLRLGRWSETGRIYLVTIVTYQRTPIFSRLAPGRLLVNALQQASPSAATLCFVVMPDHLHWLMQLNPDAELSATVRMVKATATRRMHCYQQGQGPIWQRGFYDRALRQVDDIKAAARYVVANPIRAGLVSSVREYSLWDAAWL